MGLVELIFIREKWLGTWLSCRSKWPFSQLKQAWFQEGYRKFKYISKTMAWNRFKISENILKTYILHNHLPKSCFLFWMPSLAAA